jgi:hypothetical protein
MEEIQEYLMKQMNNVPSTSNFYQLKKQTIFSILWDTMESVEPNQLSPCVSVKNQSK